MENEQGEIISLLEKVFKELSVLNYQLEKLNPIFECVPKPRKLTPRQQLAKETKETIARFQVEQETSRKEEEEMERRRRVNQDYDKRHNYFKFRGR